jgi:hypothetical protein
MPAAAGEVAVSERPGKGPLVGPLLPGGEKAVVATVDGSVADLDLGVESRGALSCGADGTRMRENQASQRSREGSADDQQHRPRDVAAGFTRQGEGRADEIRMMRPHLRSIIAGTSAQDKRMQAVRYSSTIWSDFSSVTLSLDSGVFDPALVTRMSILPSRATAVLATPSTCRATPF